MGKSILEQFARLNMSILPTPLHRLDGISEEYSANIYCKRDDLTGFAFGGNKTRKMDFLIGDAVRKKSDTLIALGANQSNFCRIAAAAGIANGLDVHLVLKGPKPERPTGNLLMDHLFKAEIVHVDSDNWETLEERGRLLEQQLTEQGRKVYCLPLGGSTPIGGLGYVSAFFEILDDCRRLEISLDVIVHASSSGGTQAGLVVAKTLSGWPGKIIGMLVDEQRWPDKIYNIACETGKLVGANISKKDIIVDDSYKGYSYGARTEECESAIKVFAEKEGILLDNVYSGKAASGLIDYAKRGLFNEKENILFIHTGGNIELFK